VVAGGALDPSPTAPVGWGHDGLAAAAKVGAGGRQGRLGGRRWVRVGVGKK
jgi:hypothetical protein